MRITYEKPLMDIITYDIEGVVRTSGLDHESSSSGASKEFDDLLGSLISQSEGDW